MIAFLLQILQSLGFWFWSNLLHWNMESINTEEYWFGSGERENQRLPAMVMIGWCDDGSTRRGGPRLVWSPPLVSSCPPSPACHPATQPCDQQKSAEISEYQLIQSISPIKSKMDERWYWHKMLLKHLGLPALSPELKLNIKMISFWAKATILDKWFVNAPPSHLPRYPWSSRSPNDLREGTSTSTRGSSGFHRCAPWSLIFDLDLQLMVDEDKNDPVLPQRFLDLILTPWQEA